MFHYDEANFADYKFERPIVVKRAGLPSPVGKGLVRFGTNIVEEAARAILRTIIDYFTDFSSNIFLRI